MIGTGPRLRRRLLVAVISCVLAGPALAACSAPTRVAGRPGTAPGAQARWFIAATAHLPIGAAQLHAHFDPGFLAVGPAAINRSLEKAGALRLLASREPQPKVPCPAPVSAAAPVSSGPVPPSASPGPPGTGGQAQGAAPVPARTGGCFVATVATAAGPRQLALSVDTRGLISGLRLSLVIPPAPATWAGVDAAVRSIAPGVRLLAARLTGGSCQPVHSIDPGAPAPLASAARLYVLGALATAVASGRVSWNQRLTLTAGAKSPGAGQLQDEPDGTRISVLDAASQMISGDDSTATDMLISLVGRPAVEASLAPAGMADPALDQPFLTARELVTLKLDQWPALAQRYLAASLAGRRALLASAVARAPLPSAAAVAAWKAPRRISTIEHFASASDICRAYASLTAQASRPGLAPLASLFQGHDGGLELDPDQWQPAWFSGGAEPGVLTGTWMATARNGHRYVVAVLAESPSVPIDEATAVPAMLSAVRGALTLAARS
jgi:beta-lactamase class A